MSLFKSKADKAAAHTSKATGLFTDAHNRLDAAVLLLADTEQEHWEASAFHANEADSARTERDRAERVRDRLADLLS